MKDGVHAADRSFQAVRVTHISEDDFNLILNARIIEPAPPSVRIIMNQRAGSRTQFHQTLDQMAADEATAARHQDFSVVPTHRFHLKPAYPARRRGSSGACPIQNRPAATSACA